MLSIRNYMKVAGMAAIALTAFSCNQEEFEGSSVKGVALNATFETPATRTSVNGSNQVVWNAGDAFKLFCTQNSESKTATFTTTTADGNSSSAAFSSADLTTTDGASAVYAIFPADIAPTAAPTNFNSVELNLPATIEADKYKESNGAMLAKPDDLSGSLQFRHMAGLLKLTITAGLNADAKSLVIEADKAISGKFTVDMTGNDPVIATKETQTEADKKITISLSLTADQTEDEVIYVPIPTGTYTTLSATIYGDNGTALYTDKTWNDVTVPRASMMTATFGFTTIQAGAETNNSLAAVLPNEVPEAPITTNVEITGDLGSANLSGGLQIPVFENSNVNLVLNTVPTGTSTSNPLVISEKEVQTDATPVAAVNNLTLTMPATTSDQEPSININMPKTTVALEVPEDATEVTYAEVTANTAVSTLVIGKGVTVKNLIVKGGNLKVSGKVDALNCEGIEKVFVCKDTEATLPTTALPANVEVIENPAEFGMRIAAHFGGSYTLQEDVTLSKAVVVAKDFTLDLNGHKVSAPSQAISVTAGTFTLKDVAGNGLIEKTNCNKDDGYGLIQVKGENVKFIMESGTVKAVYNSDDVVTIQNEGGFAVVLREGAGAEIKGGRIEAGWFALAGNGNDKTQNCVINITGGELVSKSDYAIYLPQAGTTTISGQTTVEGGSGCIAMRNGTLTVNDGVTLRAINQGNTGDASDGTGKNDFACLNIGTGSQNTYGNCTVNINGGSWNGMDNSPVLIKQATPDHTIQMNVTGGTFSDPSALAYLANGAEVAVSLAADYTTDKALTFPAGTTTKFDLNQHKLVINDAAKKTIVYGTVVFSNGFIEMINSFYPRENGDLTFDNVALTETTHTAIMAQGPNVKLTVKNGSKITGYYFALATNASNSAAGQDPTYGANATIVLQDSEFFSTETGIMNNVPAHFTIENCKFKGNHQGALLRGGEYVIKNSTFTLDASLAASHSENNHMKKWTDGNRCAFAALTIGNYQNTSYQYYTKVTMEGVKAEVTGTNAASFPAMHVCANTGADLGVTLTYDDASNFTSTYSPGIEYGTENITVNGKAVSVNAQTAQ